MKSNADIHQKLEQLLALVTDKQTPNINCLWGIAKDIQAIKLNIKFFGYDLAKRLSDALPANDNPANPGVLGLKSKPSTQDDIESAWVAYWAKKLDMAVVYHRKVWELCYVMQALQDGKALGAGKRGLGFGCGEEPISSLLASMGIDVTVTDLEPVAAKRLGWLTTNQHATAIDQCLRPNLVDRETFLRHVTLKYVDMNEIPSDMKDYDFCWSVCALEHLGSIAKGLDFVENSLRTLKKGGIAVHTTEFNFSNDQETIDNWGTVLFQRKHFEELAMRLRRKGHILAELDFNIGDKPMDKFIDLPPFTHDFKGSLKDMWANGANHMKLSLDGFPCTCFGLIIRKA